MRTKTAIYFPGPASMFADCFHLWFADFATELLARFPDGIHDERPDGVRIFTFWHDGRADDFAAIDRAATVFRDRSALPVPLVSSRQYADSFPR